MPVPMELCKREKLRVISNEIRDVKDEERGEEITVAVFCPPWQFL